MTSDTVLATLVVVTILATVAAARLYPTATRAYFFEPIESARTVGGAVLLLFAVVTFLQSGVAWLMLVAILLLAFAVTFVYFEEPHKEIR
jgi:cobalamin synthase